jgi:hypothetical protein
MAARACRGRRDGGRCGDCGAVSDGIAALFVALLLSCVIDLEGQPSNSLASSSTLSVSYAANLMSLLPLGTPQATLIAVIGVWTQCTINIKRPYPLYRTAFSAAGGDHDVRNGIRLPASRRTRHCSTLPRCRAPSSAPSSAFAVVNTGL